jgi:hypothetical protein
MDRENDYYRDSYGDWNPYDSDRKYVKIPTREIPQEEWDDEQDTTNAGTG